MGLPFPELTLRFPNLKQQTAVAFQKGTSDLDEALTADPYPTWQKLEELVEKGKVRNIGISKCVLSLFPRTLT